MIILVFGLPATGKSWLSQKLSEETNIPYLNTDIIREQMGEKGKYDPETKQQVYDELKKQAEKTLKTEGNVIIDGTFHKAERREEFSEIAKKMNNEIFFIELRAREETVKKRLRSRDGYSEADYKVYKQLKSEFESFEAKHLVLWNDSAEIDELISEVKNYINKRGDYEY